MKRISTKSSGLATVAAFRTSLNRIGPLTTRIRLLEAKRDKRIQAIREEFGTELDPLVAERDALMTSSSGFAMEHREDPEIFDKGSKTGATNQVTYGLRMGNPTLKTLSRAWTWEKVTVAVKSAFGNRFVRTEVSLDKEALKARLGNKPDKLAKIGCRIEQTEAFWVEPKDTATAETQAVNTRG